MKVKKALILTTVLVVIVVITVLFRSKQANNVQFTDNNSTKVLDEYFGNNYKSESDIVGDYLITIAYSSITPSFLEGDGGGDYLPNASPLILIQDRETLEIKSQYEIEFDQESEDVFYKGNYIQPLKNEFRNIDKDSENELISSWHIYWGGSSGIKTIIVFDQVGDTINIISPLTLNKANDRNFYLIEKHSDQRLKFPGVSDNDFTTLYDINEDGIDDILYATYNWDMKNEGHFSPHTWNLEVYEFNDQEKVIPTWWNSGNKLTTLEKIDEQEEQKLLNEFTKKIH